MARLAPLMLLAILAGCNPQGSLDAEEKSGDSLADRSGIPRISVQFFPPLASQPRSLCWAGLVPTREPAVDEFESRWYSQQLTAAKEPTLYRPAERTRKGLSRFRFTWLRTFNSPVFIRLEKLNNGNFALIAKELSGAGGYAPGTIKRVTERELSATESRAFLRLIARTALFRLPAKDCSQGCDGSTWLFEGTDTEGYHLLSRWSPDKGAAREVGEYVLNLSGWRFEEMY